MANQPVIIATVKITAKDINGNNTVKQFNSVYNVSFDYNKGMINIVDQTGSFYFPLNVVTSFVNTILQTPSSNFHTIVIF